MNHLLRYTDFEKIDAIPEGKAFKISFDGNTGMMRLFCRNQKMFECIRDAFSAENESAFFVSMHGFATEQKVYLINEFGLFKPGLFFSILEYLKTHFGDMSCLHIAEPCKDYIQDYLIPLKKYVKNINRECFEVRNIAEDSGTNSRRRESERFIFRDYQSEAIEKIVFEGFGRGMIELPTSAGKSFVIANLIYTVEKCLLRGLRYLIFVPNRQLVDQFYKDMLEYGFSGKNVTRLSSGLKGKDAFNPDAPIIISNRQYIFKNKNLLPKIDFLINDEVHQDKPKSSTLHFVDELDCRFKVGLSATIPRKKFDQLSLVGSFGRILYVKDITDLQDRGYISKLEINLIKMVDRDVEKNKMLLFHENSLRRFSLKKDNGIKFNDAYDAEIAYINENYRKLYSPILEELNRMEGNVLVLFDRLEFGQNMFELAKASSWGKNVSYIDGQTPVGEREANRAQMENTNNNILFGQCSILSTGINIKNLTNLVLMVSTKSFSRILQSIGRTLRLHKDKDCAKLYDISFNFKYSQKHLAERLGIYRNMYRKSPDTTRMIYI